MGLQARKETLPTYLLSMNRAALWEFPIQMYICNLKTYYRVKQASNPIKHSSLELSNIKNIDEA